MKIYCDVEDSGIIIEDLKNFEIMDQIALADSQRIYYYYFNFM